MPVQPYLMPDTSLLILVNECPECGGKGYYDTFDGEITCGTCRELNIYKKHEHKN